MAGAGSSGNPDTGVNPGESVTIQFSLQAGKDYQSVLDALALGIANPSKDGSLRIGLHVQSIGSKGGSDSFVNGPPATPIPEAGTILLGLFALGIPGLRRKFKRA